MAGEVAPEKVFVHGHVFQRDNLGALDFQDAVQQEKRRPVRQQFHDLLDVHGPGGGGGRRRGVLGRRRGEGLGGAQGLVDLFEHLAGEFAVAGMAGAHGDDMAAQGPAKQREVADDVEHLMADKFLGIAERFGGEHGVVADDDGVFQAAALDESVLDEKFDLLEKAKGAGVGEFLFPGGGGDLGGIKLGEAALAVGTGAGDLEMFVGEQRHARFAEVDFNGFRDGEVILFFGLGDDAGGLDNLAKFAGTAVGNGRFVGVQLDDGIINAVAGQGGEDVFHGVDLDVALGERGGAVGLGNVLHAGLDFGFPLEVHATEPHPGVAGRGQDGHVDPVPAVQSDAGKGGGTIKSLLIEHARLNKTQGQMARLLSWGIISNFKF